MSNHIGNLSTIIKFISMTLAGYLVGVLAAHNLDLGVDAATLSQIIGTLLFMALAYIDAKYPNTFSFLGNNEEVDIGTILGYPPEETVLNDEYETEVEGDTEDGA